MKHALSSDAVGRLQGYARIGEHLETPDRWRLITANCGLCRCHLSWIAFRHRAVKSTSPSRLYLQGIKISRFPEERQYLQAGAGAVTESVCVCVCVEGAVPGFCLVLAL